VDRRGFFKTLFAGLGGIAAALLIAKRASGRCFDAKDAEEVPFCGEYSPDSKGYMILERHYVRWHRGHCIEYAVWDSPLSQSEIRLLANGVNPMMIDPPPVYYCPSGQFTQVWPYPHDPRFFQERTNDG